MGFFNALLGRGDSAKHSPTSAHPLLEHVSAVLGDEITTSPDFAASLVPAIQLASDYLDNQIKSIPGPLNLNMAGRALDPLMSVLFSDDATLRAGLGRSLETKESIVSLAVAGHMHTYALLGMRMKAAEQTAGGQPVFADHTIKALGTSEEATRTALKVAALNRVIKNYDQHLAKLREKQKLLRIEWNIENEKPAGNASVDDKSFVHADELTPKNMVRGLAAWLRRPGETLRLSSDDVRVPGVSPDGKQSGHYQLPTLHCADRRQWISCIVKFPTYEAAEALKAETRIHRYIFI